MSEVFALRSEQSQPDRAGWTVRVVPNKFPALASSTTSELPSVPPHQVVEADGVHEVIIDTPVHERRLSGFSFDQLEVILSVYQSRVRVLGNRPGVRSVVLFRNDGRAAGATQQHPHSQILALPVVPTRLQDEITVSQQHIVAYGCCPVCHLIGTEMNSGRHTVVRSGDVVAITSFAPRFPFETWILPAVHAHDFGECSHRQIRSLAEVLGKVLVALESILGSFPFNLVLQTAPTGGAGGREALHWRFELLPRITIPSGLELGSDVFIVSVSPDDAAQRLRSALGG